MADTPTPAPAPTLMERLSQFLRGESASAQQIRESVAEVIEESDRQTGDLSKPEREMLANLLKFGDLRVRDVMIPRADIVAMDETTPIPEFVTLIGEAQNSRLPIYRETLDNPTGLVHIKDVLRFIESRPDGNFHWRDGAISQFKRRILFAPPSMRLIDLLLKMQTDHIHLALVIDEYGGTDGLVTIEDIIEEIVGDIADEHDEETVQVKKVEPGIFIADARTDLDEFNEQTGIALKPEEGDQEVDTLGGFVVSLAGRVPQRGEILSDPSGVEFEVLEADPRRVKRLRVSAPRAEASDPAA
jgi:magnesium and cobalt transporter